MPKETPPHTDVQRVFEDSVRLLGELGHTMIELPRMNVDWRRLYRAQSAVSGAMFAASIDDWAKVLGRAPEEDDMEPLAWASYRGSQKLTPSTIGEGLQQLRAICRQILAHWRNFDVLLSPVTLTPAPEIGHLDPVNVEPREFNRRQGRVFGYTPPYNMTGQPAISLPLGMSSAGLPIGMMFVGRIADEATLLRLATQLEEARPWRDRKPTVWG